jgi:hypothetical protein
MKNPTRGRVRAPARDDLLHLGSLITYLDQDTERCLGYLFHAEGHGSFDPNFGRVEVTQEEAAYHNLALSQAEITGLDERCEVGQGAYFYIGNADSQGRVTVTTWIGALVSDTAQLRGRNITFARNGKQFSGRATGDGPVFFKRSS